MTEQRPRKEPDATPGMYTVEFEKERLGFRVQPCTEHSTKLRVGIVSDESLKVKDPCPVENDEIYSINGYTMAELGIKTHQGFAKEVASNPERPVAVTFISEDALHTSILDVVTNMAEGAIGSFAGEEVDEDDEEEVVKVTSISFSEGTVGGERPERMSMEGASSLRMNYDIQAANDWDPDVSSEFGFSGGYHPFSLKYTKYMRLDPLNANVEKVERGYLEFGKKVMIKGEDEHHSQGEYGVIVQHYKHYKKKVGQKEKVWNKKGDTCDVKLEDGFTLKHVCVEDMTPIERFYIPLACGLSLEDLCLYGACLGCVWATLCVVFGVLMFAHDETSAAQTLLTTVFFLTIAFAVTVVFTVYIGRTLAVIEEDEGDVEAEIEAAEMEQEDEEVGLMGPGHDSISEF